MTLCHKIVNFPGFIRDDFYGNRSYQEVGFLIRSRLYAIKAYSKLNTNFCHIEIRRIGASQILLVFLFCLSL